MLWLLNAHSWLSFSLSPLFFSLRTQLTFTEAMRNKARLSITGSVGENGRVLTPDCPKAVHSGPSLRQSSGLALVSSDLPWKPKTLKCLKLHKTAKQTTENRPYSNDATKLSNRADKVDFERNLGPWWLHTPGVPPQDNIPYEGWLSHRLLCFRHVHSKNSCCLWGWSRWEERTVWILLACLAKKDLLVLTLCHNPRQTETPQLDILI